MTKRQDEAQAAFPPTPEMGARMINDSSLVTEYARDTGKPVPPYIWYRRVLPGRGYQPAAWQVIRPGFRTDPDGYWRDHGHKTFTVYSRDDRIAKGEEAKEWASKQYGIAEWKKTTRLQTHGALFPAYVVDWIETKIKEHKARERSQ
jgi:hypothetical protein